ncbi:ABC transporter ATP-binding protein [Limibacillus halophilus]|uniref:Oligopeptide/dipeptide ABC transporter ATP-binding protein n=1 Tax=Limibacillus halophilus TaxID=1579333 RepID=A0A839SU69_9PROT|nr:dipeptide ABC transporter ATP-binding protein [Limibacillus halophilus]MBB3064525.1 oligopeptide/dipeptide ABC transporter ATP-binding protein [Limibacillus halophilus]
MTGDMATLVKNESITALSVRDLRTYFPIRRGVFNRVVGHVRAVDGVSFDLAQGETLGVVGESGCGKSTVGKTILRLLNPTSGQVIVHGNDVTSISEGALRPLRREMQMVFQDPYASLNPRMTMGQIVAEPLSTHHLASGNDLVDRVAELFLKVGLRPEQMNKFPHQFSGGQRQRVAIARALAVSPRLIICDEPVSALDISIQAQIINLMMDIQAEGGLSYLFISHDLAVVETISDRIAVMYLGKIVEIGRTREIYQNCKHPYTEALMSAVPIPDPVKKGRQRIILTGDVPSPSNPPPGCAFHTRCPIAKERCREETPALRQGVGGHAVACHFRDPP